MVLATVNMVGGFVVTDRMLQMFTRKRARRPGRERTEVVSATPVWAQLAYLLAAVCFILALKGLSSPRTARGGNLVGAVGAVLACVVVFFYADLDHVVADPGRRSRSARGRLVGARRVQMTQMPQLVALFNGVGGGAAALVALLELADGRRPGRRAFTLVATAFTILVGSVSFAGSLVTFAKLQELMTSRPVVFPGLPDRLRGCSIGSVALVLACGHRLAGGLGRRACSAWSGCWSACCWCCRSAAPTCPS